MELTYHMIKVLTAKGKKFPEIAEMYNMDISEVRYINRFNIKNPPKYNVDRKPRKEEPAHPCPPTQKIITDRQEENFRKAMNGSRY